MNLSWKNQQWTLVLIQFVGTTRSVSGLCRVSVVTLGSIDFRMYVLFCRKWRINKISFISASWSDLALTDDVLFYLPDSVSPVSLPSTPCLVSLWCAHQSWCRHVVFITSSLPRRPRPHSDWLSGGQASSICCNSRSSLSHQEIRSVTAKRMWARSVSRLCTDTQLCRLAHTCTLHGNRKTVTRLERLQRFLLFKHSL